MHASRSLALIGLAVAGLLLMVSALFAAPHAGAQPVPPVPPGQPPSPLPLTPGASRFFTETGHTVQGRFLDYWQQNGGLAQQGYPLTDEIQEQSDLNGQTYTVQYFERAIFEHHPEYGPPYDVLLSLLGVFAYQQRYGTAGAPNQHVSTDNPRYFPETQHTVGGKFRQYWESHGGLAQQGYPVSDEFTEISPLDHKPYIVQYFQRAVFELHPENAGTPYEVLLSQLGTFRFRAHFSNLNLPAPDPGSSQFDPAGSPTFLVWDEEPNTPLGGAANADILGLDLAAGQAFPVAGGVGNQLHPAISEADVVWEDTNHSCPVCEADILGKNLITGDTFTVASGPADQRNPAIAGNHVAWIESTNGARRLLLKNLTRGTVTVVATDTRNTQIQRPALSFPLLVWSEVDPNAPRDISAGTLRALDLQTGQPRTLAPLMNWTATYDVDGVRVVWSDTDGVHYRDLTTGETALLGPGGSFPAIQGDTIVWQQVELNGETHLWGLRLPSRVPQALVVDAGSQFHPVLAGDWLVWENADNARAGHLGSIALARAFAAAAVRPTATSTPLPSPTFSIYPSPPATETPAGSPTAGPDIRLYADGVVGSPAAAGHYVFYMKSEAVGVTPTPSGGANLDVYGYELDRHETFLVKASPTFKDHLTSNGQVLLWLEHPANGADEIHGFNLATRTEFIALAAFNSEAFLGVAVDGDTLYYQDLNGGHTGIYARPLGGGTERLVSALGQNPVAADGVLLWNESQLTSPFGIELHMRHTGTDENITIASALTVLSSYGVAGDDVVYAFLGATPDEGRAFHYRISTRQTEPISAGPVTWLAIGGRTVVWSAVTGHAPGGNADLVSVLAYNLDTQALTPVLRDVLGTVTPWAVVEGAAVMTFTPFQSSGPAELFVQGIRP